MCLKSSIEKLLAILGKLPLIFSYQLYIIRHTQRLQIQILQEAISPLATRTGSAGYQHMQTQLLSSQCFLLLSHLGTSIWFGERSLPRFSENFSTLNPSTFVISFNPYHKTSGQTALLCLYYQVANYLVQNQTVNKSLVQGQINLLQALSTSQNVLETSTLIPEQSWHKEDMQDAWQNHFGKGIPGKCSAQALSVCEDKASP